jgi:formylglycine-generating enzyme required for sulfatase activity
LRRGGAVALVLVAVSAALAVAVSRRERDQGARCGPRFVAHGARCLAPLSECPAPLVPSPQGCDAPGARVMVPSAAVTLGPADWEAERTVPPRTIRVEAFQMDAFEVTRGQWGNATRDDAGRAASGMTRDEAAAFCAARGGRLPTEDEWIVAAASAASAPSRYPWGDTGAVCRRAAWGLVAGPCAVGADGPDTVGAHADGDSLLGLHDLAGNVAEWVAPNPSASAEPSAERGHGPDTGAGGLNGQLGVAKGGSWQSELATELRIWARLELRPGAHDPRVGVRCAYPP